MGKYISNDDGYGDEKKEMLNWEKNVFGILLPYIVFYIVW